jgi:hypothetical protein
MNVMLDVRSVLAVAIWLCFLGPGSLRGDDSVGSPEETYYRFVELMEHGNIVEAKKLTNGKVRIVSEVPIMETAPLLNVKAFQANRLESRIQVKRLLGVDRFLLRSAYAYFVLEKHNGRWVITEGGLKPIW